MKWLKDFKEGQRKQLEKILEEEEIEKKKFNTWKTQTSSYLFFKKILSIRRNAEKVSQAFDWLTAHQENFDKKQENLAHKVIYCPWIQLEL